MVKGEGARSREEPQTREVQVVKDDSITEEKLSPVRRYVDFKNPNKIIFDTPQENYGSKSQDFVKGNIQLFENDDEVSENEFNFNVKTQFEGQKGKELFKLQSTYQNDKRFQLDEKFLSDVENYSDAEESEEAEKDSSENEKKKQFEVLEQVLGNKVQQEKQNLGDCGLRKRGMLRFDPTQSAHLQYEVTNLEKNKGSKKVQQKVEPHGSDIVSSKVSKNVFYKVNDQLKETLQQEEEFSLLKKFGIGEETEDIEGQKTKECSSIKSLKFQKTDTVFDDDSSDGGQFEAEQCKKRKVDIEVDIDDKKVETDSGKFWTEPFFFRPDDFRLQDGHDFMKRMGSEEGKTFLQLRTDLKKIVKAKVRNNQRKTQLFKKKLGSSKKKKMLRLKKALKKT